jgi:hypothetical protein
MSVYWDKLSFEREMVWKAADVGFLTLLFLLEDLLLVVAVVGALLPSFPELLLLALEENSLQGGSEQSVLTVVGTVVVALGWPFLARPTVPLVLERLGLVVV